MGRRGGLSCRTKVGDTKDKGEGAQGTPPERGLTCDLQE